mmetsp:Transcript_101383/g.140802  ORF Transcript_101383/g.140802 Transcript_101383/m.140802 type:complete len:233 (-) Transcript_101383:188-886(-)
MELTTFQGCEPHGLQDGLHLCIGELGGTRGVGYSLLQRALWNVGLLWQEEGLRREIHLPTCMRPNSCHCAEEAALASSLWCRQQHELAWLDFQIGIFPQLALIDFGRKLDVEAAYNSSIVVSSQQPLDFALGVTSFLHSLGEVRQPIHGRSIACQLGVAPQEPIKACLHRPQHVEEHEHGSQRDLTPKIVRSQNQVGKDAGGLVVKRHEETQALRVAHHHPPHSFDPRELCL